MKTLLNILAGCVLAAGLSSSASATGLTLSLKPETTTSAAVGGSLTYDLVVSGLFSSSDYTGPALGAYNVTLDYDSSLLSVAQVRFGSSLSLSMPSLSWSDTSVPGQLYLSEVSLDSASLLESGQSASFTLATVTFSGLSAGTSSLGFDLAGTSLSDENANSLTLSGVSGSSLSVAAVPEPTSLVLAGLGLSLLVLRGWSRARTQA